MADKASHWPGTVLALVYALNVGIVLGVVAFVALQGAR